MKVGIVGHEGAKFTPVTEATARAIIRDILIELLSIHGLDLSVVSGGCHLGGIDIFAEEEARALGIPEENIIIHKPEVHQWQDKIESKYEQGEISRKILQGYRTRNLKIAEDSWILYNILVKEYPPDFEGRKFTYCYHCDTSDHIKSGGCWTAKKAVEKGNTAVWIVIPSIEYKVVQNEQ